MKTLRLSGDESDVSGLRIARADRIEEFSVEQLRNEIVSEQYDVCKLKFSLENPDVFSQLDQLGFYYTTYSLISQTRLVLNEQHRNPSFPEEIKFELFDGSQAGEVEMLTREGLQSNTAVYYQSDLASLVFNQVNFDTAILRYYLSFNNLSNPDKILYLIKYDNNYAGYYCLDFSEDIVDTVLVLVHPDYRSKGLTRCVIEHGATVCLKFGKTLVCSDSSIQNLRSMNGQLSGGFKLYKSFINVSLYPMLNAEAQQINLNAAETKKGDSSRMEIFGQMESIVQDSLGSVGQFEWKEVWFGQKNIITPERISLTKLYTNKKSFFLAGKITTHSKKEMEGAIYLKGQLV